MKTLSKVLEQALFALHDTNMINWAEYYTEGNEIIIELDDYADEKLYLTGSLVNNEIVIQGLEDIKTVSQLVTFINNWRDTKGTANQMINKDNLAKSLFSIHDTEMIVWASYDDNTNYIWIHCENEHTHDNLIIEGSVSGDQLALYRVVGGIKGTYYPMEIFTIEALMAYINNWRDTHNIVNELESVLTEIIKKDRAIIAEYEEEGNYIWIHCFDEDAESTLALEGFIRNGILTVYDVSGGINGVSSRTSIKTPKDILDYVKAWELDLE